MRHLHGKLGALVTEWRQAGYPSETCPTIVELLDWAVEAETGHLRYLRPPQFRALEVYWYLRLVEGTPKTIDLYRAYFDPSDDMAAYLDALGIPESAFKAANFNLKKLVKRVESDDDFVRSFKLESLRESLTLDYPSYILALAMGAGKTILIGAIIATEFAMALEYPDGPFVQNALVFAPGKTIIESLRELAEIPYERLLPPRLHRQFATHVKLTFTRDGEKDIPVIRGSNFNVVVTNTEKIRIQKETIRKSDLKGLFSEQLASQAKEEVANLRLQAIASLPHLAVFSDEAHHTYGQSLDAELKKVRKTVDYLAEQTNLVCVVNTTGTPYFKRQPLRDVVVWYGLSEGIRDGILKDLAGSIQAYDFEGDPAPYVEYVVEDFFRDYANVKLRNGAPAKLAIYFPQTDDVRRFRPNIDNALARIGLDPAICLVNTSDTGLTKDADVDAFNRLNAPSSPYRVILLVNKGTEGWNCPSLFACALARRLRTSNNFVLQAATRCLRQVPGNDRKARVYLSSENFNILDRQLRETYGETIADLNREHTERIRRRIVLRKVNIPPLVVPQTIRTVARKAAADGPLALRRPKAAGQSIRKAVYTVAEQQATESVLRHVGSTVEIETVPRETDAYGAACDLAARYRTDLWTMYDELRRLYGAEDVPLAHVEALAEQIEQQTRPYEITEERVDVALALVKPEGFDLEQVEGAEAYVAEIVYPKDKEKYLIERAKLSDEHDLSFHYDPYNFDSMPEMSFFEQILAELNVRPDDVEGFYFTGAITDPEKTDFFVEYKDDKDKWRRYTPDFIIRKKAPKGRPAGSGKVFIVEIKDARFRDDDIEGKAGAKARAVGKWVQADPDRFTYHMIPVDTSTVAANEIRPVLDFIRGEEDAD